MQSLCIITTQRRESTPRSLATVSALASAHSSASVADATVPFMAAPQVIELRPSPLIQAPQPATRAL